ncbi:MAG TPA: DUF1015 domain-containing protein [Ktedonobacteraceae bacterium]|nr:DUF1015 domain-containing protein [Ktedonobacteraceae bacterium]
MADVRALRGIRYNDEVVSDLAEVVTPPYDVISKEAQAKYYARNPYNVIRLELGEEQVGDNTLNNRYTRAAAALAEWRLQGVLRQDALPGYYLYQQVFSQNGQQYTRTSLLARVRLEPWSSKVVLPHEHTMSKPKDDRLKLLRACATNLSPIMSLYDDPQGRIRRLLGAYADKAEVQITDEVGEGHRLQHITDPAQIDLIQNFFAERQLYIADGHHRYETALNYREEIREQRRQLHVDDAVQFVLMALVDVDDPGLLVLPTHRLLSGLPTTALRALSTEQLARYFTVSELGSGATSDALLAQMAQAGTTEAALVLSTGEQNWLLRLNEQGRRRMAESGHSAAWNELDVAVAHTLILEALLGIQTEDVTAGSYLRYTRDAQQAVQAVQTGEAQAALLLNATRVRQIRDVSQADDRMPQKSTYFYPKLITGLVMNPLW